jgi:hypothetical protein
MLREYGSRKFSGSDMDFMDTCIADNSEIRFNGKLQYSLDRA